MLSIRPLSSPSPWMGGSTGRSRLAAQIPRPSKQPALLPPLLIQGLKARAELLFSPMDVDHASPAPSETVSPFASTVPTPPMSSTPRTDVCTPYIDSEMSCQPSVDPPAYASTRLNAPDFDWNYLSLSPPPPPRSSRPDEILLYWRTARCLFPDHIHFLEHQLQNCFYPPYSDDSSMTPFDVHQHIVQELYSPPPQRRTWNYNDEVLVLMYQMGPPPITLQEELDMYILPQPPPPTSSPHEILRFWRGLHKANPHLSKAFMELHLHFYFNPMDDTVPAPPKRLLGVILNHLYPSTRLSTIVESEASSTRVVVKGFGIVSVVPSMNATGAAKRKGSSGDDEPDRRCKKRGRCEA